MNRINPEKLLNSKWTSVTVKQKERHFIVTKLLHDDQDTIVGCQIEAVINNKRYSIDWQQLKDSTIWQIGWK